MQIRIKSTPAGPAPEDIRERWIGCVMDSTGREKPPADGVIEVRVGDENEGGYVVTALEALRALAMHDMDAHRFWDGVLDNDATLIFAAEVCEEVSS